MAKKLKRRTTYVDPAGIEFKQSYSDGARIEIVDSESDYVNGKPTKSTVLDMDNEFVATSLYDEARKAIEHHREQHRRAWKRLDEALKVTS